MTVLLPSKSQRAQKGFKPYLDIYQSEKIVIAEMVIGNGSYFRHCLGIYSTKEEALKKAKIEFKNAKKLLKK